MSGKVLVIDDEAETLSLLKATLQLAGYEVAAALTGQAGITLAVEFRPDVILLDVMMPDLTGIEVLESIKKQLKNPPPIVILSAAGRIDDIEEGMKAGAHKYLVKPVPRDTLLETVKSALDWRHKVLRRRIY